jgi:hypothetical protein
MPSKRPTSRNTVNRNFPAPNTPKATSASRAQRKSVEDVTNPRENQDPASKRKTPPLKETENPPNENLQKHSDEAYGDTEIPGSHRRQ